MVKWTEKIDQMWTAEIFGRKYIAFKRPIVNPDPDEPMWAWMDLNVGRMEACGICRTEAEAKKLCETDANCP